jgi:hypothetical protein
MNNHLALIKTAQSNQEGFVEFSCGADMALILIQAKLMDAGSTTFKAIKSGELAEILTGLTALSYTALQALAFLNQEVAECRKESHLEYKMPAIMRLLSDKINDCSSGTAEAYSELYNLCAQLASGFLNADFDKSFKAFHTWYTDKGFNQTINKPDLPDLSDCMYE